MSCDKFKKIASLGFPLKHSLAKSSESMGLYVKKWYSAKTFTFVVSLRIDFLFVVRTKLRDLGFHFRLFMWGCLTHLLVCGIFSAMWFGHYVPDYYTHKIYPREKFFVISTRFTSTFMGMPLEPSTVNLSSL